MAKRKTPSADSSNSKDESFDSNDAPPVLDKEEPHPIVNSDDDEEEISAEPHPIINGDDQEAEEMPSEPDPIVKDDPIEPPAESTPSSNAKNGVKRSSSRKKLRSKKGKRQKRRATRGQDSDADAEELKSKLLKRGEKDNPRKTRIEVERGPMVKRATDDPAFPHEIVNPSTYDKLFTRLEETGFNKATKPDGVYLEKTPWICCFCQRGPCVDDLGDLFGPYHVKLSENSFWPPFVDKFSSEYRWKGSSETNAGPSKSETDVGVFYDLWFHGDCVYWAPGILLRGWGITGLEENLPKYWGKECYRCEKYGASIACNMKGCYQNFHYPCATATGCVLKESNFSMYCESHKKHADKRK